jgi:ribose/xylose/arabinose/galactoside ABC-type transport system permease subunit
MTMSLQSFREHPAAINGAWFLWLVGLEALLVAAAWMVRDVAGSGWPGLARSSRWKIALVVIAVALIALSLVVRGSTTGDWLTMAVAVGLALWLSAHLGLLHGLLITKLKLQPFVVTLCGLMCYRGLSRYLTGDKTQGLGTEYNDSLRLLAIGKPCTATAVMLFFGVLLMATGIWIAFFSQRSKAGTAGRTNGLLMLFMGLVLAVIASSRYWDGWETQYGEAIVSVAGMDLRFFSLEISETAVARPARLMGYALFPMLGCLLGFLTLSGRTQLLSPDRPVKERLLRVLPLLVVLVALLALTLVRDWIDNQTITLTDMSAAFQSSAAAGSDDRFVAGVNVVLLKMLGVFTSMALLMGGILWLGKTWAAAAGTAGRVLWLLGGFFAVLWLLGKTAIHETVVQTPFFFLLVIGALAALFLNTTVLGRYFFALGNNEEATRYSGINTDNITILAYVLCALCGGIGAVLFTLDSNNVEPSGHGSFYELYAIAAAVLGGCSLRGGEGSVLGVIIGASIMRVLYNAPDMIGIASQLEMFTIGFVLLIGIIVDETARRMAARRERRIGQ